MNTRLHHWLSFAAIPMMVGCPLIPVDEDQDGFSITDGDCDDTDPSVHPDAKEVCNKRDTDCDGEIDSPNPTDKLYYYLDADLDGYGDPDTEYEGCEIPEGYSATNDDCDDQYKHTYPGAYEWCDAMDNDCDGVVDPEGTQGDVWLYLDADGDGFGDPNTYTEECIAEGYIDNGNDCDDDDATIHPRAEEVCDDGIDNNCNDLADDDDPGSININTYTTWHVDNDEDGFGDPTEVTSACAAPAGHVAVSDDIDCDDDNDEIYPGADEYCDGVDRDCNGQSNEANATDCTDYWRDDDGDDWGVDGEVQCLCDPSEEDGYTALTDGDCDDTDAAIHPDATEVCDGNIDNNCNDLADDEDPDFIDIATYTTWYVDNDEDGYGYSSTSTTSCTAPSGYVEDGTDCDDTLDAVHPDSPEICGDSEGLDEDCDGVAAPCRPSGELTALSTTEFPSTSDKYNQCYGDSLAFAGDLNEDGFDDIVVGSPGGGIDPSSDGGMVIIRYGSPDGTLTDNSTIIGSTGPSDELIDGDWLGHTVMGPGDITGDGIPDLVVSAPQANRADWDESDGDEPYGMVYLFEGPIASFSHGSLEADLLSPLITLQPASPDWFSQPDFEFGRGLASLDVNGDDITDVLISSLNGGHTTQLELSIYLLQGPLISEGEYTTDESLVSLHIEGKESASEVLIEEPPEAAHGCEGDDTDIQHALFSHTVADINGDGQDDIIWSTTRLDGGGTTRSKMHIVLGRKFDAENLMEDDADIVCSAPDHLETPSSVWAQSLAAGDLNGDGAADLLVGHPDHLSDSGHIEIIDAPATGTTCSIDDLTRTIVEGALDSRVGRTFLATDLDGDAIDDLVFAANPSDELPPNGSVGIIYGEALEDGWYEAHFDGHTSTEGDAIEVDGWFLGTEDNPLHGNRITLASGGDANNDDFLDLLVGTPEYDPPDSAFPLPGGRVHLFAGGMTP